MEPKYIMIFAIVCLIITHTPLDRFASNFDWGILEKYGYLIHTTDQTKPDKASVTKMIQEFSNVLSTLTLIVSLKMRAKKCNTFYNYVNCQIER